MLGFWEILTILLVGVIFLGPDKLPNAVFLIAKTIKKLKILAYEAQEMIEEELYTQDLQTQSKKIKPEKENRDV